MSSTQVVSEKLMLRGPSGPLEALLEQPESSRNPQAAAVICHPHPLYQGAMTNKVVYMLARTLVQQGIPALRFNFRGVGKSAGEYDQGRGETEDALAALDWLKQRWPGAKQWLGGFSFGAYVALAAASRRNIAALITVAPPVERFAIKTLELPQCPWLLIQGEADEVVDPTAVLDWASRLQNPPTIKTLPETGHYFHGKLNMLRNILIDALPSLHDN